MSDLKNFFGLPLTKDFCPICLAEFQSVDWESLRTELGALNETLAACQAEGSGWKRKAEEAMAERDRLKAALEDRQMRLHDEGACYKYMQCPHCAEEDKKS